MGCKAFPSVFYNILLFYFIFLFYSGYIMGSSFCAGWSYFITTLGKCIIYVSIKLDIIINIILNSDTIVMIL